MASIINASSSGSGGIVQTADASGVLQLQTNGSVALTASGGKIGIGASSPSTLLDVQGTGSGSADNWILLRGGNTGGATFPGLSAGLAVGNNFSNGNSETNLVWGQTIGSQQYFSISKWASSTVTEQFRISSAGYVTMSSQPRFFASNRNTDTSGQNLVFNTVFVNTGSFYSTSTGRFTAPIAGVYMFTWGTLFGASSNTVGRFYLYKNGSSPSGDTSSSQLRLDLGASGSEIVSGEHSFMLTLAANDYVNIYWVSDDGQSNTSSTEYSYFTGQLIG